jgi:hypothetical protein
VTGAVYLPLLLPVLLWWASTRTAERVRPSVAVRGLVAGAVATAAASVWSLVLLALTLFDDLPALSGLNQRHGLRLPEPVPDVIALTALAAAGWAGTRLVRDVSRRRDTVRRLREAGPAPHGLLVADWAAPLAVAVPGRPGHVLVTSGMLRLLDAPERRAVLAHERAHLAHRHHRAVAAVAAAAALNPLLRPVREAVTYLVERWADEDAAAAVGDRALVARAVARAALATTRDVPAPVLGMHGGVVVRRVQALLAPPGATGGLVLATSATVTAACLVAGAVATVDFVRVASAWLG